MSTFELKWNIAYDFWKKRSTKKALYLYSLILNSLLFFFLYFVYTVFLNSKMIDNNEKVVKFFIITTFIIILCNLLLFIFWLIWRRAPRISEEEIGILFAPHTDKDLTDLIYSLYKQIAIELKKFNILNLKYQLLPSNIVITNPNAALEMLSKTGARLIVYGYYSLGKIDGDLIEGFKEISFTVRHRSLLEIEKKPVMKDLAGALAYRKFTIKEKNSFIEDTIVAENISEVTLFFISVGLTVDGRIDEAITILENLLQKVISLKHKRAQIQLFENSIKSCLTIALSTKSIFYYETYLIDNITNRNYDNIVNDYSIIVKKLINLNKRTSDYYLQKGIIDFHFGRLQSSWESIQRARALSPKNEPTPYFSSAFLCLWTGRFKSALNFYTSAFKCYNYNIRPIMQILLFLQGVLKNNSDKYQIYFALAIINDNYFDQAIAIEDYKSFLINAENNININKELQLLIDYSQKRIEQISSQK